MGTAIPIARTAYFQLQAGIFMTAPTNSKIQISMLCGRLYYEQNRI
jgi:hypothetical protein